MRAIGWTRGSLVLSLGGLLITGSVTTLLLSQEAVAETQQTGTPLSNPTTRTTQAGHAAKITPEQEAALVEVRKILQEAKQAAESYTLPSKLTSTPTMLRALEQRKTLLLEEIEQAQLRAGDLAAAMGTKRLDLLALAQAQYGDIKGAIQTATRNRVAENELLTLVDTVIKAGDIPAAVTVAQSNFAKNGVELWRQRNQAAVYALIARRQHEAGDPEAPAMLRDAIKSVPEPNHTPDRYLALLHVARTQAIMGDRAGSADTFRKAIDAGLAQRELFEKVEALRVIAKAQAESGNRSGSDQTFQQAIQIIGAAPLPRIFNSGCIAWSQFVTGNAPAGIQTFQRAIRNVEQVEMAKRGQVLRELGNWQVKAGDVSGAHETVLLILRRAESLSDLKAKSTAITSAAGLAVLVGDPKQAIELTAQVTDDWEQAGLLSSIAKTLVRTHDPFGSPEVFQQLAETAAALLKHPPPKDSSKKDTMRFSLALVQAAAGDVPSALRTADTISHLSLRVQAYGRAARLLTAKADFAHAKQVIQAMDEEWLAWFESESAVQKLAQAQTRAGDEPAAIIWAQQQKNMYAKGDALLGAALGLMEREGIVDVERLTPETSMRDQCPSLLVPSL